MFAERFKSARLLNGFSLQDLADRLGKRVTRQALHRYEKGEVLPDSTMIGLLSDALNVRPDFFFRTMQVVIGEIEYRKLRMPVKEEAKIREQTRDYLSRYIELEEILGIEHAFDNPLKDLPPVSTYEQVNAAAELLRECWDLGKGAIVNIPELLEERFVKVVRIDADASFDGLQTFVNGTIPVVAYNSNLSHMKYRVRFTLLHELAHLLLQFGDLTHAQKEKLCHQFAGAMLLPEATIKKELGAHRTKLSFQELGNVKRQYGISMQALVMRANVCGIVNDHYVRQFFNSLDQMGWGKEEPVAYEGTEESGRFDQLVYHALAEELISTSKAAALKNQTLAAFRYNTLTMK